MNSLLTQLVPRWLPAALAWICAVGPLHGLPLNGVQDAAEAGGDRPNILLAVADDWGWPHAGALGARFIETPTFDSLAARGVLFEHAYVSSPSCTPSRNAILTGQDFYRLGEGANLHSTLDVEIPTFMGLLRDAGYAIGHHRKAWGPGKFKAGGYQENPCGPARTLERFLAEKPQDGPFCFWLGTSDPHRGYEAGSGVAAGKDLASVDVPSFFPDTEAVRSDLLDYALEVERWDRDVGAALATLEAAGELEDTLIVMTSDHGMPFPRCKGNLYDAGTRVPLVVVDVAGKRVRAGEREEALVSLTDLAPTFLELAGLAAPEVMTGRSLLPHLRGIEGRARRADLVFGRERHTPAQAIPSLAGYPARAIRTERWLLIRNFEPIRWPAGVPEGATHPIGSFADCDDGPTKREVLRVREEQPGPYALCFSKRPELELYDTFFDADQCVNLVGDPEFAAVLQRLWERLDQCLEETSDPRRGDAPPFDAYEYRAGYLAKRLRAFEEQKKE